MPAQTNARDRSRHRRRRYSPSSSGGADLAATIEAIPTITNWWRANDTATAEAAIITTLTSRVGSNDMTDPGGTQPVMGLIGTKKAVVVGTNDYLQSTNVMNLFNPYTFIVVLQVTTLGVQKIITGTEDGTQHQTYLNADNTFMCVANNAGVFGTATTNPTLLEMYNAGAGSKQYQDGTLLPSQNSGTSGLFKRIRIGNNSTSGNVKVAEIMTFSAELTAPQRATVRDYVSAFYGFTVN